MRLGDNQLFHSCMHFAAALQWLAISFSFSCGFDKQIPKAIVGVASELLALFLRSFSVNGFSSL